MDKVSAVSVTAGEFVIKNILTIGEETQIAVRRATLSNGMYGQMMQSPNVPEMQAGWNLFRLSELEGRISKPPDEFKGCEALSAEQFDELWKAWTEKSGLFLRAGQPADPDTGDGEGES